jgi:oligosaccharide:H+ symporter
MGIVGQPFMGYLCDLKETNKYIFIISFLILFLLIVPFPFYNSFLLVTVVMGMIGFIWSPQQSILDSWIMESSPELANNYGFMRAWGSIGFALTVIVTGRLIEEFSWNIIFLGFGLFSLFTLGAALLSEDKKKRDSDFTINQITSLTGGENSRNPLRLLKNLDFLFLLVISFLMFIPNQLIFTFLPTIIEHLGGSPSYQGYVQFFTALSEAPILFLAALFLKRYKPKPLLLVSAIFYLIRMVLVARATGPTYLLYFGLLQSLSFAIFLPTARFYVNLIIPDGLKTTAQTLLTTICFGLGGIIASLFGGFLIDVYGLKVVFNICILFSFSVVVLLVISIFFRGSNFSYRFSRLYSKVGLRASRYRESDR